MFTDGLVESAQTSTTLVALPSTFNIVFIALSMPYETSVFSSAVKLSSAEEGPDIGGEEGRVTPYLRVSDSDL